MWRIFPDAFRFFAAPVWRLEVARLAAPFGGAVLLLTGCVTPPFGGSDTSAVSSVTTEADAGPATSAKIAEDREGSDDPGNPEDSVSAEDAVGGQTVGGEALTMLNELPVKGRAPRTGYSRDQFGQRWKDIDRNGCDQRNDVLARDLADAVAPAGCKVESGVLSDPYTGEIIHFQRGQDTSSLVQIDHVVALADAWQKGAQQMSAEDRERFANDQMNLLAVDGSTNQAKGAGDAATWLPPNKAFRCEYVSKQVEVKHHYGLWVTQPEKDAIARELAACAPISEAPTVPPAPPQPEKEVVAPAEIDTYYPNCSEARAAGVAPIYKGQPGYRPKMDGDGDGIACE